MIFRVGLESNNEGVRSIAWALEHPGCFAYGVDDDKALVALPEAIRAYVEWIGHHELSWVDADVIELHLEDTWADYDIDENFDRIEKDGYTVDAWFQYDWKPLTELEIERGLKLLAWSRVDLLAITNRLAPEQWAYKKEGERWDISGIVRHIGNAEWWYLDRLSLSLPQEDSAGDPMSWVAITRARLDEVLPTLQGVQNVLGAEGEFWSPRKVLRRALWHERDHTEHIRKLIS